MAASGRYPQVGTHIDGYLIDAEIERGGMGVVYRATQLDLGRRVALKVIHTQFAERDSFRDRFKREARLAATIDHPHVVAVHAFGECRGLLYIVMECVEGTDLARVIADSAPLEPPRAIGLVKQVADALDALHEGGLVHRDVKPSNILIGRPNNREHVYLTDFGVARHAASAGLTLPGDVLGTPDYMAPEQWSGAAADARTDVYALGCVLFEALTGIVPYPRHNEAARLFAHVNAPPASLAAILPELPDELDIVVARALAKAPADRYQSAGDLGRAAVAALARRTPDEPERTVARGDARPTPSPDRDHEDVPAPDPMIVTDCERPPPAAGGAVPPQAARAIVAAPGSGDGGVPPAGTADGSRAGSGGEAQSPRRRRKVWFVLVTALVVALVVVATALRSGGDRPADVLVLIDVSKSMALPLGDPDMPSYTRIDAVRDYAIPRLAFLDHDGDRVGVWLITTSSLNLPMPCRARRPCKLIPLTDATPTARTKIQESITPTDQDAPRLEPNDGGTPLYRSIRAGVQALQRDGAPDDAVKTLVVITDGDADENKRPDEDDLPSVLPGIVHEGNPVQVIITSAGKELCEHELIPNVVKLFGGACYDATTIEEVQDARDAIVKALHG